MKLKKLKLNQLNANELNKREMDSIFGGGTPGNCACGCAYDISLTEINYSANKEYGYTRTTTRPGGGGMCSCAGYDAVTLEHNAAYTIV